MSIRRLEPLHREILKRGFAFSLVELMISLITISCIAAAFTPVITKKLKKQDVALSIAQTSEIKSPCPEFGDDCKLCTKAYCVTCEKTCDDGKYAELKSCVCKNCSEHDKIKNDDLTKTKCVKCSKDGCVACKNTESDEGKYYVDNGLCKECPKDTYTDSGGSVISLYYCDGVDKLDKSKCSASESSGYFCNNGIKTACNAKFDALCSRCTSKECTACTFFNFYNKTTKKCESCKANCGTCKSKEVCDTCYELYLMNTADNTCSTSCRSKMPNCSSCSGDINNYICTICDGGYYVNPSNKKECKACSTISNCYTCDNNGNCTRCNKGYYIKNGKCYQCNGGNNCAGCNSNGICEACINGYHLDENNNCVANDNKFSCSDSNFMQIGKLCITRKNMGDSGVLPIPSTVTVAEAGEYCFPYTTKCCWKGTTTASCDSEYGNYSGCNRTVCSYAAAAEICAKFNYGGKTWRLAYADEMKNWMIYTLDLSANGLQLCQYQSGYLTNRCDWGHSRCPGSYNGSCQPASVWVNSEPWGDTTINARVFDSGTGGWGGPYAYPSNRAYSFRCVTEME